MKVREEIAKLECERCYSRSASEDRCMLGYKLGECPGYYNYPDQILKLIEQEYEPAELEPLTDEEIQKWCDKLVSKDGVILNDEAMQLSQATIAKNQKGQLYRLRK